MNNFNKWLGLLITNAVGTMWCAYLFTILALISLPAALSSHDPVVIVAWIAQTFLQLVLLSIIMFGQNTQAEQTNHKFEELLQTIISNQVKEEEELEELVKIDTTKFNQKHE